MNINLILTKLRKLSTVYRKFYFKWRGLRFGKHTYIGKISCDWPQKITIGNNCTIQDYVDFRVSHPFNLNNFIEIGNNVFIGRNVEINCQSQVTISDNCWIASNTTIVDIYHEMCAEILIRFQPIKSAPIVIAEDVWIGSRCIILNGVHIGKGSVVGAGSVVNRSIPPYQIWAGAPAKFIKNR